MNELHHQPWNTAGMCYSHKEYADQPETVVNRTLTPDRAVPVHKANRDHNQVYYKQQANCMLQR